MRKTPGCDEQPCRLPGPDSPRRRPRASGVPLTAVGASHEGARPAPTGGVTPGPHPLRLLLVLGALSALGPASMDIYLPGLPEMTDDFGTGASTAQLTIALFLVGLGAGQLIAGPLSDTFGRRRPMLVAIAVYIVASLGCALTPSIGPLIAGRLLQGLTASAGIVIARAVVRDLYGGAAGARYLSRLVLIYGIAPVVAPLVGGQILRVTDWRGLFVGLAAASVALFVGTALAMPETLAPADRQALGFRRTRATFAFLLRDRAFLGCALTLGCATAAMMGYIAASPYVLEDVYGVSPQLYGVFFGINALAMVAGAQVNAHAMGRHEPRTFLVAGVGMLVVVGLLLVGSVLGGVGLWGVAPSLVLLMACWGFIPANAVAVGMAPHPEIAGSASAALGVFQYGTAALVAPVVGLGGRTTALPMALTVLGLGLLATLVARFLLPRG